MRHFTIGSWTDVSLSSNQGAEQNLPSEAAMTSRLSSSSFNGSSYLLFDGPKGDLTVLLYNRTLLEWQDISIGVQSAWAYASFKEEPPWVPSGGFSSSPYPIDDLSYGLSLSTLLSQGSDQYAAGLASWNGDIWIGGMYISQVFHNSIHEMV